MATVHIASEKGEIASKVLMPGDPYRARYIGENFLEDAKCINETRGMLGYTGYYKGKRITVFASGMGGPSIGIYAYELYHFYDVQKIIRIGTAGSNDKSVKVKDVILADNAYTLSSYPKLFFNDSSNLFASSEELNKKIREIALEEDISLKEGTIITSDVFDAYLDHETYLSNYPKDLNALACEMEAAILFAIGKNLGKQATCLLTVVDSVYEDIKLSSKEREQSLNDMILLALNSLV